QMYHVKEIVQPVPGNLDLNIADEEEFSPDKLRANLERLYMTVGMGSLVAFKHIARLRSWRETQRTAAFASVYAVAWLFDLLVPLFSATLIALIMSPSVREVMFPPAPIALVSSDGGVQKPRAGVLGSHDSATGAPENHKGEATEAEARNFVNSVASVALASAAGKHPQGYPNADETEDNDEANNGSSKDTKAAVTDMAPDPTALAMSAANAKDVAAGGKPDAKHDKTKVPMETAVWTKMRPFMHMLADVADTWERMANALSPTPPFPQTLSRLRLATVLVPLLLASLFIPSYMFTKGVTAGIGIGIFGDPVLSRGYEILNRQFPHWQKLLELRNTLLKGVPTNAQLTLTLLRIGEANKAPLPPPPRHPADNKEPPMQPAAVTEAELRSTGAEPPLNATPAELDAAMAPTAPTAQASSDTGEADINASKGAHHGKKGSKLLGFFKGTTKGTVRTALGANTVRATMGSRHAKERQGVVEPAGGDADLDSGPVDFQARFEGKRGRVYITAKATIPAVAFSTDVSSDPDTVHPRWSIPIGDIRELKKVGGFGWKTKIVVGWSLNREMADGLEITDRTGKTYKVTAMPLRDELFNRLIAIGGQKWEAW
ncbi:hypothetical protein SCUCBS95973_009577, partial [Sporothrix curviconia]